MSDKRKYPRRAALEVARELCAALKDVTRHLVVAGSLRRGKQEVGDVEVLYVPKMVEGAKTDLFASPTMVDASAVRLEYLIEKAKVIERRLNSDGHEAWGQKNKLARHIASGIPVDFFSTTEANWWVSLVIRTGSKETNLLLTTGAQKLGRTLNAYGCGVTESDGTIIPATSEQHVFELCGVPFREPKDR